MKLILLLTTALCSGCISVGKITKSLTGSSATTFISIQSIQGNVKLVRANPGTNSVVTVSPDGTMSVERK